MAAAPALVREIGLWGTPLATPAPGTVQVSWHNDGTFDRALRDCAFEGWPLEIFTGAADQPLQTRRLVFSGVVTRHESSQTTITLSATDRLGRLMREIQSESYRGDGGPYEGSSDLMGQLKPLALGRCFNVPAVAVDRSRGLYQLADPAFSPLALTVTVEKLWTGGVPIVLAGDSQDLENDDPPNGQALYDSSRGLVKLAGPAGDGNGEAEVTADIRAEAAVGGSSNPVALARILAALAAFAALEAASDGMETGLFLPNGGAALAALDQILAAGGLYRLVTGAGRLTVARLRAPTAQSPADCALALTETDILEGSFQWDQLLVPAQTLKVSHDRNNLIQTDSLAAGADPARLDFLASRHRYQTVITGNRVAWPGADTLSLETGLIGQAAAAALALELAALFGAPRLDLTLEVELDPAALEPGQQVWLSHERFFPRGRAFLVLRIDADSGAGRATLRLYG